MTLRLTGLLLALLLLTPEVTAGEFRSGAAMRIITPDPFLPVSGGVGEPNAVTEKRGELTARAMVFSDGETTIAVVGLDVLGFPSVLGDRVRKLVPRLPAENIIIGASHTHSAPDCYAFPLPSGGSTGDLNYMQSVCEKAAEAINEALDQLQPAVLKIASDKAAERIAYNYYAPQLYDRRMAVIQTLAPDGKVIGTLVNYAIHPEVLGSDAGIVSPDCIGPLCDQLEEKLGGMAMFINGAQGGMVTADNRDPSQPGEFRSWNECLRIGQLMATEAKRIITPATVESAPILACDVRRVEFPVETAMMKAIVAGSPLNYPHTADFRVSTQVNLIQLGSAQILTIPGEALPNIGFYLKRKMKGEHNLLFGLTNDAFGYILTEVDYDSFERYSYVSRTSLGEKTGTIFLENALEMIAKHVAEP
ncbi:MAG TPA: hypothetical protein PLY87_09570 [Planctomycetaceae bacterium]|nr:hypothetical protein [Planctomycetaceae bacterium]